MTWVCNFACVCASRTLFPYIFPATLTFLTSAPLTPRNERLVFFLFVFFLSGVICLLSAACALHESNCSSREFSVSLAQQFPFLTRVFLFFHSNTWQFYETFFQCPTPLSLIHAQTPGLHFQIFAVCFCTFSLASFSGTCSIFR